MRFRAFDPFTDLDRFWANVDRSQRPSLGASLAMDAVRRDDTVIVHVDLPGVDADSIDLTVDGRDLTLRAERRFEVGDDDRVIARERRHGRLGRTFHLGDSLDPGRIEADYRDGVLVLTIPVAEEAKPRKVAIGAGRAEAIETTGEESGES